MRYIKIYSLFIVLFVALAAGCQNMDQSSGDYVERSRGLKALYKKEGAQQADENGVERSIFRNAYDSNQTQTNKNRLGRTPEPGTDMARNTIPYGYVEHSADDSDVIYQGYGADIHIDRDVLADAIAQVVVGLQNITDSAVIVTDQDVIIGYKARDNDHKNYREQVKLSGESITPRWYHVYATEDIDLVRSIKEVTKEPSNDRLGTQLRKQVDFIIQQLGGREEHKNHPKMKSSPSR